MCKLITTVLYIELICLHYGIYGTGGTFDVFMCHATTFVKDTCRLEGDDIPISVPLLCICVHVYE